MRRRLALLAVLALAACGRLLPAHQQTIEPARLEGGAYRLDRLIGLAPRDSAGWFPVIPAAAP